jgi:hypothetical protein
VIAVTQRALRQQPTVATRELLPFSSWEGGLKIVDERRLSSLARGGFDQPLRGGLETDHRFLKARADRLPEGPSEAARGEGRAVLVGVARNEKGKTVRSRLRTPEGYTLTAETAFDSASRIAAGEIKSGFQTPSLAFGADYILNFDGVTREDFNS